MIAARIAQEELQRAWGDAHLTARIGLAFLALLAVLAIGSTQVAYQPGTDVNPALASMGPGLHHPLGTDHLGRDTAWRVVLASQAFVWPGLLASVVATGLGLGLGIVSGWVGGVPGTVARWLTGSIASLPRFVWVLLVCAAWGDSPALLGLSVGAAYAPSVAETVHARLEELRATEVLLATRAHGLPSWRRLWIHAVLAGCGRRIARHAVLCFGFFLVVETTLAYIGGFGVREPQPSWGNMLAFEWGWSAGAFAPAIAIWLAVVAVTVVADGLQEDAHG